MAKFIVREVFIGIFRAVGFVALLALLHYFGWTL